MIKKNSLIVILVVAVGLSSSVSAQTVVVDTSRGTNHFVPTETLGAGVDRIPVEAIDKDLLQTYPVDNFSERTSWKAKAFYAVFQGAAHSSFRL